MVCIAACKDLLKQLLRSNPSERLSMSGIMCHPWMNEAHTLPFGPAPFPNKLQLADIDNNILQHMVHTLKVKVMLLVCLFHQPVLFISSRIVKTRWCRSC